MSLLSLFWGELAIWLGALAVWLWPAYVRHRLMWGLWFWLHPTIPRAILKADEPAIPLGYHVAHEPLWPGFKEWLGSNYTEPNDGLQNAYNQQQGLYGLGQQNAALQNMNASGSNLLGGYANQARFIPSIGDWRSWYGNASIFGNLME